MPAELWRTSPQSDLRVALEFCDVRFGRTIFSSDLVRTQVDLYEWLVPPAQVAPRAHSRADGSSVQVPGVTQSLEDRPFPGASVASFHQGSCTAYLLLSTSTGRGRSYCHTNFAGGERGEQDRLHPCPKRAEAGSILHPHTNCI